MGLVRKTRRTEWGSISGMTKVGEVLLCALIIYTFFFQYAVSTVSGAMIILSGLCVAIMLLKIITEDRGRIRITVYAWLVLFVVFSAAFSLLVFSSVADRNICIRMIEYVLIAEATVMSCHDDPRFFFRLCAVILCSTAALAVYVLQNGSVVESTGAIGIEQLNVNEMSSFYMGGFFCAFVLMKRTEKRLPRILIMAAVAAMFGSGVIAASRRGFIISTFMLFSWLVYAYLPTREGWRFRKRFFAYLVIGLAVCLLLIFARDSFRNSLLGMRLEGQLTGGDVARRSYQAFAWEQFMAHPVLGIGINGIAHYLGRYSHSLYYECLACTGVVGSLILVVSFCSIGGQIVSGRRRSGNGEVVTTAMPGKDKMKYYQRVGIILWLSILASGISVVMIYSLNFYIFCALLTALPDACWTTGNAR